MELQELIFIFLILLIPIILVFSYYLNLQGDTIRIQIDYDGKFIEATKEAIEAYEINTTEWSNEYNSLSNVRRRELNAATNVFITGLANKLGIGGTSKENILNYVPAIVYTMYDGYYIFSPTYTPKTITDNDGLQIFYYGYIDDVKNKTDGKEFTISAVQSISGENYAGIPIYEAKENGSTGSYKYWDNEIEKIKDFTYTTNRKDAVKEYKHILKTFVPYSDTIGNYTINYTLDNYVRIYGENTDGILANEGYILENDSEITITSNNSIKGIKYNNYEVSKETLTENIPVKNGETIKIENYPYIYTINGDKRYCDENGIFTIDNEYNKRYFRGVNANSSLAELKKVLVRVNDTEYKELFQLLNPENDDAGGWYEYNSEQQTYQKLNDISSINGLTEISIQDDCSAINYCIENYCFNKWIDTKTSLNKGSILENRKEKIIENINDNLNLSVANYSANSKINYKLPELSDDDWEQALSNISMITFLQGMKIGLKTYNNYSIITSTENDEYIKTESLYYVCKEEENEDEYYHSYPCNNTTCRIEQGYRNTEFKLKEYEGGSYYKHTKYIGTPQKATYGIRACFNCIVNRNKNNIQDFANDNWTKIHYNTLARERYIQMSRTGLIN